MSRVRWTKGRRSALEAYVADLATRLRLSDWTITVDWSAPAEDSANAQTLASMQPAGKSRHATLRLGATFLDLDEVAQRQVLCHELVHCHLFALHELVRATFPLLEGEGAAAVAEAAVEQQVELATDALADVLTPLVPVLDLVAPPAPLAAPAS